MGHDDDCLHSPLCGILKSVDHLIVQNQIGRHNVDVFFRMAQNIQVDLLSHIFLIQRTVAVWNHESGSVGVFWKPVVRRL